MNAELERIVTRQAKQLLEANGRIAELHFELERLRPIEQRARETVEVEPKGSPRRDAARYILGAAS